MAVFGLDTSEHRLRVAAGRVTTCTRRAVADEEREQAGTRRVLVAFDPVRQLERGWTLTLDADGALVRRAADVRPGQRIATRFVDGQRTSVVEAEEVSR
ncbi:MAG TPA: exodeoxyribonuclease VII large subunit [Acidimicrobiales bacterium]|nr:exodeoxyribonuclease VII large subunit [Acidimicrobiales bacterium]